MTSERPAYPGDRSDKRWKLIEPVMTAWRAERSIGINAPSTICAGDLLPQSHRGRDGGTRPTTSSPGRDGLLLLRRLGNRRPHPDGSTRRCGPPAASRPAARPHAAIADAQSVRTSADVTEAEQGIDAGRHAKGRKRHIAPASSAT